MSMARRSTITSVCFSASIQRRFRLVNAGDPAASDDVWLRPITNENHTRRSAIHHGELKKYIAPPDDLNQPWKLEVSGRLGSLVGSISKDAQQKVDAQKAKLLAANKNVPSSIKYCGILYSEVENVRSIPDFDGDVVYDPTDDVAHANIIIRDKGLNEILTVTEALLRHLKFLQSSEVAQHPLFSSCA
jgi:hypothetical protein